MWLPSTFVNNSQGLLASVLCFLPKSSIVLLLLIMIMTFNFTLSTSLAVYFYWFLSIVPHCRQFGIKQIIHNTFNKERALCQLAFNILMFPHLSAKFGVCIVALINLNKNRHEYLNMKMESKCGWKNVLWDTKALDLVFVGQTSLIPY